MNAYIKGIAIFKDSSPEGKRTLKLSRGLNIITGHSKTGKSALLDIIDWCLGAKESTIPKGIITAFAKQYAVLIKMNGICLLLARANGKQGENYMYVNTVSNETTIEDIEFASIINNNTLKIQDALVKINEYINIGSGNIKIIDVEYNIPNVTIRSALAFNFQHQDIIKNNSQLFYIEPIKNHFPILAGWFDSDYYIVLSTIDKLNNDIKKLLITNETALKGNVKLEANLRNSLRTYYNLIGIDYKENWTINDCLKRIESLEIFKREEVSNKLLTRQEELTNQKDKLQAKISQLIRQLQLISTQKTKGESYQQILTRYKERATFVQVQPDYFCPICNNANETLSVEALKILEAEEILTNQLLQLPNETNKFDVEFAEVKKHKNALVDEFKALDSEYKKNENILDSIEKEQNLNQQKEKARYKVTIDAEIYNERHLPVKSQELDRLNALLTEFKEKKRTYNEKELYINAKKEIEDRMSSIVEFLDFEHKPARLFFELNPTEPDKYKLYHNIKGEERVFLREIGSASNALACHLGLFLSTLSYFCRNENSKVPSFLFLDQPSQVYFPSGTDNNDIEKVAQIYETLLNEISIIEEESGFTPQIIVADHIKDLGDTTDILKKEYFKADWRNGGLI